MGDITQLLQRARAGDKQAFNALFEALYPDLRRIARARLAPHVRGTMLDTTALVHEAYLKFEQAARLTPGDRVHFLAYAANVMRSIIVDAARAGRSQRRGGDAARVTLDTNVAEAAAADGEQEILDVDAALGRLAEMDERLARVVEMRYFGGMTEIEIGEAIGVTERTVRRDWEKARLLLAAELRP
jgi:RNA polymerase sigma factor (TIGR02999 family)